MRQTMRPINETVALDEALTILVEAAVPTARTERVRLTAADGRVLAAPVTAPMDVPPLDRAAMDGYAVRAADTFGAGRHGPETLRAIATVYTGEMPQARVGAGECVEIAIGAPMPEAADAVVIVEETARGTGNEVRIFTPVYTAGSRRAG